MTKWGFCLNVFRKLLTTLTALKSYGFYFLHGGAPVIFVWICKIYLWYNHMKIAETHVRVLGVCSCVLRGLPPFLSSTLN